MLKILAAMVILCSVARAETLISRAQRARAAGKLDLAYAYANAAVDQYGGKEEERDDMKKVRDSIARAWFIEKRTSLGALTEANAETTFATLASLKAELAKGSIEIDELKTDLDAVNRLLVARAETLAAAGDYGRAEALLAAIVATDASRTPALDKVRAQAYLARTTEAKALAGHTGGTFFHLSAAAHYGGAPDGLAEASKAIAQLTHTQVTVLVREGDCFGMQKAIESRSTAPGVPVTFEATVSGCATSAPKITTGSASLPYQSKEKVMVPGKPRIGHAEECTEYGENSIVDTNGHIVGQTPSHKVCHTNYFAVQDPDEEREITVRHEEPVGTTSTTVDASGSAHVRASWPGDAFERDVAAIGSTTHTVYDRPHYASPHSDEGSDAPADAQRDLISKLRSKIGELEGEVRKRIAVTVSARAAADTDPIAAEDDLVLVAILTNAVPPALEALARDRYHMGPEEVAAAVFGKPLVLAALTAGAIELPPVPAKEIEESADTYVGMYFDSATGRSAVTYTFDLGYARSTAPGREAKGAFVAGMNFFWAVPLGDHPYATIATLFDFRAGTGGLVETRGGIGPGLNFHGVVIAPMVAFGVGKLGTPDEKVQPNFQYNVALEVEAALRLGFSIPHVAAIDATFARRRRIDTDYSVANRVELALRVRPVALMLQYTQLSTDTADYFGPLKLAHEGGQVLEVVLGFGI